ncbi:MAG: hypothetical protein RL365_1348 [Bacteroidota bacterium]|jgi:hypothetical protein
MTSKLLLPIALFFSCTLMHAQNLEWVQQIGGVGIDNGSAIVVDSMGNSYTVGTFNQTVDFDPSNNNFTLVSAGNDDIFISKLDPSGNFIWAKQIGGVDSDQARAAAIDTLGNIYIASSFIGTINFTTSSGNVSLVSYGVSDIFLAKLDSLGNILWGRQIGGTSTDLVEKMAIDGQGDIVLTGSFYGTTDFDPGNGVYNLTCSGTAVNSDVYVCKLNTNGDFIWAKQIGGIGYDFGNDITFDNSDNLYITGQFNGTCDFDPGFNTFNLTSIGGSDVFILKLNGSGDFLWVKQLGSSMNDSGKSINVDNSGEIYISGFFLDAVTVNLSSGNITLTPFGGTDVFIAKINSFGDMLWAKQIGGNNSETSIASAVDNDGNLYCAGIFKDLVDFNPGSPTFYLQSEGDYDIFLTKFSPSGEFNWAERMGGVNEDYVRDLAIDLNGNILSTGYFQDVVDFDPGSNTLNLNSFGSLDGYTQKLNQCGLTVGFDVQTACDSYTWIDGITYTSSNNNAQFNLLNAALNGCDSLVNLNLTLNASSSSIQYQTGLDNFTWPVNGQTYTQSGTYTAVIPNAAGCDSSITLDLTLNFTGIKEQENSKIIISPNPATDYFVVSASEELIGEAYSIIDLNGKTLKEGTLTQKEKKIEIGNLSEGIYLFKINNVTEQTFRILKN